MSDAIQQIKDRLNILDVISPYVELHKAGKNFKGKSPFSSEKTPSFYVSPDRGMYYCFSTSQGGDMFTFVQAMEGIDFKEALKLLAQKAGVELVPEDPKKKNERERLYSALEEATVFYHQKLAVEPEARAYLKKREVSQETIDKWRIGFAPGPPQAGWRELKDTLTKKGYSSEEMLRAGLIKMAGSGKEPFDVFRDRVVFPMSEPGGKVVAFSGRILHPDERSPKYVNSPETPLYKKSELLFGYNKAKEGIRKLGFSLIVEGQFDVVMCHQAGYNNTVAVSGTALTTQHVQLLERLSERVVLALDADRAGISAMKKAAAVMLGRGLDVKVAEMPLGHDPADMIAESPADFKKVIGKAVHVIEFLLHILKREGGDERTQKRKAREEILPFILLLPDRIDQEHFVSLVAKAIGTPEDAVRFELGRLRDGRLSGDGGRTEARPAKPAALMANETENHHLFLQAALAILDVSWKDNLEKGITHIHTISPPSELDQTVLSKLTFQLEEQFTNLPPLAVAEEVVARLNHYKKACIKNELAKHRGRLLTAEASGDEGVTKQVLVDIRTCEGYLREPDFTVDDFIKKA